MTTEIQLVWDSKSPGAKLLNAGQLERALLKALSKAGGDAARAMKAASNRSVRQRKRLRVTRVNNALPLAFPSSRVKEIGALIWRMKVSGAVVPVAEFPHRQVKRGVSVAINWGKRAIIRSAFVATMRSGHEGVFERARTGALGPATKAQQKRAGRKGRHVARVGRLPIEELFTTRVSDVFADGGMVPAVMARTQKVFASSFERLLPLEIARIVQQPVK